MLICVQLETCHANKDGTAWYAYFAGDPSFDAGELAAVAGRDGAPLGFEAETPVEVPNDLSEYAGLRRFYVGFAC